MKKKNIVFLGYSEKETTLINFLRKQNKVTVLRQKRLTRKIANNCDLIISFGYNKIITKNILKNLNRHAINLHISYLPYNKGSNPNYWSFVNLTPKGVSIHEIDEKIDAGNIIFRKKINFKLTKNLTFKQTYLKLKKEIENLFIKNHKVLISGKYKTLQIKNIKSFNNKRDLPRNFTNWNVKIKDYLKNL